MSVASGINKLSTLLMLLALVTLTACGGGADTESQQPGDPSAAVSLLNPTTQNERAFKENVWSHLVDVNRCGKCHSGANDIYQQPLFVNKSNIKNALAAAMSSINGVPVANLASPNDSLMVTIIRNGHKQVNGKSLACWLASDAECADAIKDYITAWNTAMSGTAAEPVGVPLVAPPIIGVAESKTFPAAPGDFNTQLYPLLKEHCAGCHSPTPTLGKAESPFFASNDINEAYQAVQQKIDLLHPGDSRLVYRLAQQSHNCWKDPKTLDPITGLPVVSCTYSATEMENAIAAFAKNIDTTPVDPNLIISKALRLQEPEAIVAASGARHIASQIALWEFKNTGGDANSKVALDTSGVEPLMPLTLTGDIHWWDGGYGIDFINGKGFATYQASKKLYDNITSTGEYSIEAWIIPANAVQQNKNIVSYSGGKTSRNFTISQNEYNYQFQNRANTTDSNGDPLLTTDGEELQTSLQHIVMTFDKVNGRRMYVNGVYTDDLDPESSGLDDKKPLDSWDSLLNFVIGNEFGVSDDSRAWKGTYRMIAIHNRALSEEQIQQNFKAGVGKKFFLLFSISDIPGVPADSYIKVQGEQFDTYSYLFTNPTYVNLGNPVPTINIPIKGMRIGINGKEAVVGQAFIHLAQDTITSNNQELSRLGSVIAVQQGTKSDYFFLSFETLGTENNPFVEAVPPTPSAPADLPAQSDIGVRTFSEINATMSELTGVPTSNAAVFATYTKLKQQLPSTEDLNAFVPANIIGISQMAFEYCNQLVEDSTLRASFFGAPYNFTGFSTDVTSAFGTGLSSEKQSVVNALYDRMIGIPATKLGTGLADAPTRAEIMTELIDPSNVVVGDPYADPTPIPGNAGNLFDRLMRSCGTGGPANNQVDCADSGGAGTREIVKAMCTSVLGNAAVLLQ